MKFNTTFSIQLRSDITHEVSLKKALNLVNLKYLFDMNENVMLGEVWVKNRYPCVRPSLE